MNFIKPLFKKIMGVGVSLLLIFLLLHPLEALNASRAGMKLWLETLLPTLLPFMILTGILIHTGGMDSFFSSSSLFWAKIFGLSPCGAYAFLLGMLCGYPMGAKIASDLYNAEKISKREAHYLLAFSNNASPAFLVSYLYANCLDKRTPCGQLLLILIVADTICMLFFRFVIYQNKTKSPILHTQKETPTAPISEMVDVSIMNGIETITRLGGYILMFSILTACINYYWNFPEIWKILILGCCEVTTGLSLLAASKLSYPVRLLASMSITAFGGLCIMAQTKSILKKDLQIYPYLTAKLINAAVTGILTLVIAKIV